MTWARPSATCATAGCVRPASWYSVPEGNRYGNRAPRRCRECCDAIRWAQAHTDEQIRAVLAQVPQDAAWRAGR